MKMMLWLVLAILPRTVFGATEVYTGYFTPNDFSFQIPVTLELESAAGRLSGTLKAPGLTTREGVPVSGAMAGVICSLRSERRLDEIIELEGECAADRFEGQFWVQTRGKLRQQGRFSVAKPPAQKADRKDKTRDKSESRSAASMTSCIRANSSCLAACPADPNEQFLCANRCKHRFATCKTRLKTSRPGSEPSVEIEPIR